MKKIVFILIFLMLVPTVFAKQGHMKLLAVSEADSGYTGETADLYLEIQKGSGRVFLDTFPFTKLDTQMSTRFAKEIACNYLNIDCDNFDFIYTIKASSAIVGGPSAGAAITVLTIAMLDNLKLNENATVTGTINSGGIIGPVGGVKEKIDAGIAAGMKIIFIPKGERFVSENDLQVQNKDIFKIINITKQNDTNESINKTTDLISYGKEKGVRIVEISTVDDILSLLTNKKVDQKNETPEASPFYTEVMKSLAIKLCTRSSKLKETILENELSNESLTVLNDAVNLTEKGKTAFTDTLFYASASYCFGANVKYKFLNIVQKNLSKRDMLNAIAESRALIINLSDMLDKEDLKTLTDLESYIVVKERLLDASGYLDQARVALNDSEIAGYDLAYGIERIYSAYAWNNFYGKGGKEFILNQDIIKKSCFTKLAEAEERYQYLGLFYPIDLQDAKKDISDAYADIEKQDYKMCLFQASKAKSTVDSVLSAVGVDKTNVQELLQQKLDVVQQSISKQISKGIFPILGYSYYEYAKSLKDSDVYSALIYSEDALELSNLDLYFKEKPRITLIDINIVYVWIFFVGFFIGALLIFSVYRIKTRKKSRIVKNPGKILTRRTFLGKKR